MKIIIYTFVILFSISLSSFAQSSIGINCNLEANRDFYTLNPLLGINYKHSINKGSLSVGVLLRTFTNNYFLSVVHPGNNWPSSASVQLTSYYLSIPLLYQFNTKIINVAVGPSYDIYLGNQHKVDNANFKVTQFSAPNEWGVVVKINKEYKAFSDFVLVPEIRFQRVFESKTSFYSIGCGLQYLINGKD